MYGEQPYPCIECLLRARHSAKDFPNPDPCGLHLVNTILSMRKQKMRHVK